MSLNRILLFIILTFTLISPSFSTHILGGEMTMQHIFDQRYELKLILYYDGLGGSDVVEDSILVSSFDAGTNLKIEDFIMTRTGDYENPPLSNSLCSDGLNVRIYTYSANVFIDKNIYDSPDGYYLSWQRCCRAGQINNISASGTTGFVFYMEFPSQDQYFANSSSIFKPVSGDYYCLGENVSIDFSASDKDGDDLVYSLATPLAGFSRLDDNVITGMPGPYPLSQGYYDIPSINPVQISADGRLNFVPAQLGIYTISLRCEEFRNGRKIGEVIRDFAILIRDCEDNSLPEIAFYPYMGDIVYMPGDTVLIKSKDDLCHGLKLNDPDGNSFEGEANYVSVESINSEMDLPEISVTTNRDFTFEACFQDCNNPGENFFQMRFIVRDDHCPIPARDTVEVNFLIVETEDIPPEISTNYVSDLHPLNEEIEFDVFVNDPDSSGIEISFNGENFEPSLRGMNFDYSLESCCDANGKFSWMPDCENTLDLEFYKLLFVASGRNCGNVGDDSLEVELFVENSDEELLQNLWLPNVITPNGDGYNDELFFSVNNNSNCLQESFNFISIYNRWGREVFRSEDINFRWKAADVSSGQYFYQMKAGEHGIKGFLHILK